MIKKCLFPVAGYGTRFLPVTKTMPKEMLPIVNKPLIQYAVEEALNAGCISIGMVTGRGKRNIEDYFDINFELEHHISGTSKEQSLESVRKILESITFSYTRQSEMLGLGHAILSGEPLIGSEPFAVILADDFCLNDDGLSVIAQMARIYEKYKCSVVAIEEVDSAETSKYGIIKGDEIEEDIFKIDYMVEKPSVDQAPSNLAIIGRYILQPGIFDILRSIKPGKNNEIQITDALMQQAKTSTVLGYKFKGKRYDCGTIDGFVEATNVIYEKMKAMR